MPKTTRNSIALSSFVRYCENHPEERFWQALRNWSRFSFILGSRYPTWDLPAHHDGDGQIEGLCDTFNIEGLEGTSPRNKFS